MDDFVEIRHRGDWRTVPIVAVLPADYMTDFLKLGKRTLADLVPFVEGREAGPGRFRRRSRARAREHLGELLRHFQARLPIREPRKGGRTCKS